MKKYIFILDLDNTIIGNCNYQIHLYTYASMIKNNININKILLPYYDASNSQLIRPHFIHFINKMQEIYKNNVYFYIYTASSKKWANLEIKLIETANNIKFNRPIFTRDNCKYDPIKKIYIKEIQPILAKINAKSKDNEIIIIDDNDVYTDFKENHIKCKAYNFVSYCNLDPILMKLPDNIQIDLLNGLKCPINNPYECNIKNKIKIYKSLYNICRNIYNNNKKYHKDIFWLNLSNIIEANNIDNFNNNIIKQLTNLSNKF